MSSKIIISDKLLGKGAYGEVYLAHDEKNREYAVKCCANDNFGTPNIMEANIMKTIIHPNINSADKIYATDLKLYIIQDLAVTDLCKYTRKEVNNHRPSLKELKFWCSSIVSAVNALHRQKFIHCDIKAGNILLFSDGTVKLADFTLSVKKYDMHNKFTHSISTSTHRPLECLLRKEWNESADIWSLGCTFYEIAYGQLLFPGQIKTDDKKLSNKRYINCLLDWNHDGFMTVPHFDVEYKHFELAEEFHNDEMREFNDFIYKMLVLDPVKRSTVYELVYHSFLEGETITNYSLVKVEDKKININERDRILRYIRKYKPDLDIEKLAFSIYCKCPYIENITEIIKSAACVWIASKLILGYPFEIDIPAHIILPAEREICNSMRFCLDT